MCSSKMLTWSTVLNENLTQCADQLQQLEFHDETRFVHLEGAILPHFAINFMIHCEPWLRISCLRKLLEERLL